MLDSSCGSTSVMEIKVATSGESDKLCACWHHAQCLILKCYLGAVNNRFDSKVALLSLFDASLSTVMFKNV